MPGDRALVRAERRLPGLSALLDEDAFAELLANWLPGAGISGVRAEYVRYKPETSCLVSYRVESSEGQRIVHARAERDDAGRRLQRLAALADLPTALGPGALVLEERALAVLPFPNDRRLPALRALASQATRRALVGGAPGDLEVLAYKPERRLVARAGDVVVRAYTADGWPAAARAVAGVGRSRGVRVPELRRVADANQVLSLAWMPGRTVEGLLGEPGGSPAALVAAALRALHGSAPAGELPTRRGTLDVASLTAAGRSADVAGAAVGREARDLAARLADKLAGRLPGGAVLHGDFSIDQVLIDDEGAVLIDFDAATLGHPVDDLASCLGDLELRVIEGRLDRDRAVAFGEALLAAYAGGPAVHDDELGVLTAAALLRRVAEPFRRRRADWPARMEAVVQRAAELVRRPPAAPARAPGGAPLDRLARIEPPQHDERLPRSPLVLERAWPAGHERLSLEYAGSDAAIVAGEWRGDGADCGAQVVLPVAAGTVALHAGADPGLPGLAGLLRRRGARLVSHRAGRRAVVRLTEAGETLWVKVLRPSRATPVAETLEIARGVAAGAFAVPEVVRVAPAAGAVTCRALPGRALTALLGEPEAAYHAGTLGAALRRFHAASVPPGVPVHGAAAEAAVLDRWVGGLHEVDAALARDAAAATAALAPALVGLRPDVTAPLHRDLHDGQVLVAEDAPIGVLDFDTLAVGDPALDVANLLAHFDLRAAQAVCSEAQAARLREALLDGYDAESPLLRRVEVYERATRIRLACVYAYRPRWSAVAAGLLRAQTVSR
jgi:Ser/Thr protein kinase RdoA (MazF antagonist)